MPRITKPIQKLINKILTLEDLINGENQCFNANDIMLHDMLVKELETRGYSSENIKYKRVQ